MYLYVLTRHWPWTNAIYIVRPTIWCFLQTTKAKNLLDRARLTYGSGLPNIHTVPIGVFISTCTFHYSVIADRCEPNYKTMCPGCLT